MRYFFGSQVTKLDREGEEGMEGAIPPYLKRGWGYIAKTMRLQDDMMAMQPYGCCSGPERTGRHAQADTPSQWR